MDSAKISDEPLFNGTNQPKIKIQYPQVNGLIIKHITKSVRITYANLLVKILKLVKYDPNDVTAWMLLLHFARIILAKPNRTGQSKTASSLLLKSK